MVAPRQEGSSVETLAGMLGEELSGWRQIVILGIGNEFGSDDKLGLFAAQRLKEALSDMSGVEVLEAGTTPENFTGLLRKLSPSHILFIDAAETGEKAGAVKIIEPHTIEKQMPSTHGIPLYMLVEYLKHELNCNVTILGIQPKRRFFGGSMSEEVENSVSKLVLRLPVILSAAKNAKDIAFSSSEAEV